MNSTITIDGHQEGGAMLTPATTITSTDTSILADLADPNDPRPMMHSPWLTRLHDVPYAFATDGVRLLALRLREGEQPYPELPRGSERFERSTHALLDDAASECLAAALADLRAWAAGPATRLCGACDELAPHELCPACQDAGYARLVIRLGRIRGETVNLALLTALFERLPVALASVSLGESRWGVRPVRFIAPDWRLVIMPLGSRVADPSHPEFSAWR